MSSERPNLSRVAAARPGTIAAMLLCAGFCVALAWPHFSGTLTFIGDSDRLNTFLNIKLFEAASLQEWGRTPWWNERNLTGMSLAGAYWMLPGAYPDAWLHARQALSEVFRTAGHVSFLLLAIAQFAAYLLLVDISRNRFAAFVGATMYACSAFSLSRLGQVDPAFATLIAMPIGLLALRRTQLDAWRMSFLVLGVIVAAMFGLGFLQEVAYTMILLGSYALYLALARRNWMPLAVLAVATVAGLVIAAPRIITVFDEFRLMARTSALQGVSPEEVLRFFAEGMYGRFHGEAKSVGNGINLHEGLLIYSSATAALLLFVSLFAWAPRRFGPAVASALALSALILYPLLGMALSLALGLAMATAYTVLGGRLPGGASAVPGSRGDLEFFLLFLVLAMSVVLVPEIRWVFHQLFLRVDFLHSRFTIAALIPLAVCVSIYLSGLLRNARKLEQPTVHRAVALAAVAAVPAVALLHVAAVAPEFAGPWFVPLPRVYGQVLVSELIRVVLAVILICAAFAAGWRWRSNPATGTAMAVFFGLVIVGEAFLFARHKIFGPHTLTYPVAFRTSNYFNVPADALRPPGLEERRLLQRRLLNNEFRSIVIARPDQFPAFVAPHAAEFYGLRLVDGYPALPRLIAELPWPGKIVNLRSLSFRSDTELPWLLLSVLNVRQAIVADQSFFYGASRAGDDLRVIQNPYAPLPRHFFAHSTRLATASALKPVEGFNARVVSPKDLELRWWKPFGDTRAVVIRREANEELPIPVAEFDPLSEPSIVKLTGHRAGTTYFYRLRQTDARGRVLHETEELPVVMARSEMQRPQWLSVKRVSNREVELAWTQVGLKESVELEVQRGLGGSFADAGTFSAGISRAVVDGLPDTTSYTFRIRTKSDAGMSPHSEERSLGNELYYGADLAERLFGPDPLRSVSVDGGPGDREFAGGGRVDAEYLGDRVVYQVDAGSADRFLVVNELYHPKWRAYSGASPLPVYRTNQFMRGVVVPAGATRVEFRYEPFLATPTGVAIALAGVFMLLASLLVPVRALAACVRRR